MLNYVGQFFKTRVVFNTLCLDSEMRSLTPLFRISDTRDSLSDYSKNLSKPVDWKIFAPTSLSARIYM